ncbi:hypothetical protein PCK1_000600 [Pneumocystis canis]|nr:hypothetical protein PCK1_000600 [Pneumocystis canis]
MATRDRTRLFIAYRQSCLHHPVISTQETCGLLKDVIEMDRFPPDWSGIVDEVEQLLSEIVMDREALERLYKKNILPGFNDRRKDEDEIERLCMLMTQRLKKCHILIKTVVPRSDATQTEIIIAKNVQTALANKVQAENIVFRKRQTAYVQQLYGIHQNEPLAIQNTDDSEKTLQLSLVQTNEANIISREQDIMDIAKRIFELSNIFEEIQSMVTDQGSLLDSINIHIDNTATHLHNASKELNQAGIYQKKSRKRKYSIMSDLDYYKDLSSETSQIRSIAASKLIEHVQLTVPKNPEKIEHDDPEYVLKHILGENGFYTLKRLIKGLSSSRDHSRLGFSTALSEFLFEFKKIDLKNVIQLIEKYININGDHSSKQEKELLFGRLFGLKTIILSKILQRTESIEEIENIIDMLITLSLKKGWLREPCFVLINDILVQFQNLPKFQKIIDIILKKMYNANLLKTLEGVAIILTIQQFFKDLKMFGDIQWNPPSPLSFSNLETLIKVLKDLGRGRGRQADSPLSKEPNTGLDPTTLRSWPEPKSRCQMLKQQKNNTKLRLKKKGYTPSTYMDRSSWNFNKEHSKTLYIGNLSFYTTEEQIYELFSKCGDIKRIIMGLDRFHKTYCGFAFVEYDTHESALDGMKFINGTKLDDRVIRTDMDPGFTEGRQYGRGRSGGQVRDEYRTEYDPGRGGWGHRRAEEERQKLKQESEQNVNISSFPEPMKTGSPEHY